MALMQSVFVRDNKATFWKRYENPRVIILSSCLTKLSICGLADMCSVALTVYNRF